jgi:hypothetical protein
LKKGRSIAGRPLFFSPKYFFFNFRMAAAPLQRGADVIRI